MRLNGESYDQLIISQRNASLINQSLWSISDLNFNAFIELSYSRTLFYILKNQLF